MKWAGAPDSIALCAAAPRAGAVASIQSTEA